MKFEERYSTATNATSLADEAHKIGQVDVIKASGMSGYSVAAHYLRLITKPTREDMERLFAALLFESQRLKLRGDQHHIVATALGWLLNQQCGTCKGAGEVDRKGSVYRCGKCNGTGSRKEPSHAGVLAIIDHVRDCRSGHSSRLRKLLT